MQRIPKVRSTLEFKLEALRRVRSGEAVPMVAREIGVPEEFIRNWVTAQSEGKLGTAENGKPIRPEQMERGEHESKVVESTVEDEAGCVRAAAR